jgi:hypothetical protein
MATIVEPGQRSATLEPRTVKRAIAMYLGMAHHVMVDGVMKDGQPEFSGVTLNADGSAHVTLHEKSPAFQQPALAGKEQLDS